MGHAPNQLRDAVCSNRITAGCVDQQVQFGKAILLATSAATQFLVRVSDVEFSSNLPDTGIFAAAFGGGFDSATWPGNPTAVNNVPGSPQCQKFPGDEGRRCVVRVPFGSAGQTSR